MPLLDHLIELRQRLFYAGLGVLIAFVACWFVSQPILDFLLRPLNEAWIRQYGSPMQEIIYTAMTEAFFTRVKLAFFGAVVIAFPFIAG
jgi:sec-independent protein translocase protein TatC